MSFKKTIAAQKKAFIHETAKHAANIKVPPEGWLRTMRTALGLTLVQLAAKLKLSHSIVARNEHAELEGAITIQTMNRMAQAMNCRFVYAIVPNHEVNQMLYNQARQKALKMVQRVSEHMALEDQKLSDEMLEEEIERVTQELLQGKLSDIWDEDL